MAESRPVARGRWSAMGATLHRAVVAPFVRSTNPPGFDALGVAVGLFVGLGIPFGMQMAGLGVLRLLLAFNSVLAFLFTWVANPFTLVPLYYGYYRLGCFLLRESVPITREAFLDLLRPLGEAGYFWQSLGRFGELGWDILVRWSLGALLVAPSAAILAYIAAYCLMSFRARRRAQRMGLSYEQLIRAAREQTRRSLLFHGRP
ncbi:MAG: DUF2062 domain-containing protein [Thermodesulfobacteriota bacterium]